MGTKHCELAGGYDERYFFTGREKQINGDRLRQRQPETGKVILTETGKECEIFHRVSLYLQFKLQELDISKLRPEDEGSYECDIRRAQLS